MAITLNQMVKNPFSVFEPGHPTDEEMFIAGEVHKLRGLFFHSFGKLDLARLNYMKAIKYQPYNLLVAKYLHQAESGKTAVPLQQQRAQKKASKIRDEL